MSDRLRIEDILARNLRYLMDQKELTEMALARRSGVSQKSINNVLHRAYRAKLDTCAKLAKAFGLECWQLVMPGMIADFEGQQGLRRLVKAYFNSAEEGQRAVLSVAEREAQYRTRKS